MLKQPDLAKTLEALAAEGPGLMYGGALGKKVIERLVELGGCLTMDDLMDTKAQWIDPVSASYRGRTIHVPPPPCEAFQYLLTLRILEGFDLGKLPRNGTDHIDTVLRAIRVAAGVRIANGVPSPAEAGRAPVGRPCREPAGARARRQAGRRADRAMDGAGVRRPHHVVLDRRQATATWCA